MTTAHVVRGRLRSRLVRASFTVALGAIVAVSMCACADPAAQSSSGPGEKSAQHSTPVPDATDSARLQRISADPLLVGSSIIAPTPTADVANFDLKRGHVVVVQMGGDPDGTVSIASAHAELERVRSAGWTVVAVECLVDPTFTGTTLYAVKSMGTFTAAMEDFIAPASHTTSAYAPFHSEHANPWTPNRAVTSTCIDGPDAPTSTTESVDTNIGQDALV